VFLPYRKVEANAIGNQPTDIERGEECVVVYLTVTVNLLMCDRGGELYSVYTPQSI
jgi:hypothetical protein